MAYARSQPDLHEPDLVFSFLPLCVDFTAGKPTLHKKPGVTIGAPPGQPASRGRIRLHDSRGSSRPVIEHRLLDAPQDLQALIAGQRKIQEIFAAPALAAYVIGNNEPPELPADDAGWETFIRHRVGIGYHSAGSCRQSASETSNAPDSRTTPALFTKISICSSLARADSMLDASVTSRVIEVQRPAVARMRSTTAANSFSRRAAKITSTPAPASTAAKWAPKPPDAPVTNAVFPAKFHASLVKAGILALFSPVVNGTAV
jgi:hypothetical protein